MYCTKFKCVVFEWFSLHSRALSGKRHHEKMQGVTGCTFILAGNLLFTFYILALTSMSLRDFPFLLEMIGGSLKFGELLFLLKDPFFTEFPSSYHSQGSNEIKMAPK